jgi:hypothetical protein
MAVMAGKWVTIWNEGILAHSKLQHRSSPGIKNMITFQSIRKYSLGLVRVPLRISLKLYGYSNLLWVEEISKS